MDPARKILIALGDFPSQPTNIPLKVLFLPLLSSGGSKLIWSQTHTRGPRERTERVCFSRDHHGCCSPLSLSLFLEVETTTTAAGTSA